MRRSVLLVVAMVTVLFPVVPVSAASFEDVPDDHIFAEDIEWLADSGITRGCNPPENTRFCPEDAVTRGEMAAFLVRALGLTASGLSFEDTDGSVFEEDISKLAEAGITLGCNPPKNDRFCPEASVTRGEMAAFLVRALGLTASGPSFEDTDGSVFEEDISKLAEAGITLGCNPPENTRFCPEDDVSRGQMAAFLRRALGDDNSRGAGVLYGVENEGSDPMVLAYDIDVAAGQWQVIHQQNDLGLVASFVDFADESREFVVASGSGFGSDEPETIKVYDAETAALKDSFPWPTSDYAITPEFRDIRISEDGRYLAAVMGDDNPIPDIWLEVVRVSDRTLLAQDLFSDQAEDLVDSIAFTADNGLILGLNLQGAEIPSQAAAIGVIPSDKLGSDDYLGALREYRVFTNLEAPDGVDFVEGSPDGSQVAYVVDGELWVMGAHPEASVHKITTGPVDTVSAQFSPDGSQLALSAVRNIYDETGEFVIPNHRHAPINLHEADHYLITTELIDSIVAWWR